MITAYRIFVIGVICLLTILAISNGTRVVANEISSTIITAKNDLASARRAGDPFTEEGKILRSDISDPGLFTEQAEASGKAMIATDSIVIDYISSELWSGFHDVAISGSYAYCVNSYGLLVVDITSPFSGVEVGRLDLPGETNYNITISGNYAYISQRSIGIQVVDISNPALPQAVTHIATPGTPRRMTIDGNYLYLANGYAGLRVFDISNPADPVFSDSLDTPGYAFDVVATGSYAFVADNDFGLQVVSISNPASLSSVGSLITPYAARGVGISGNYAYVADKYTGMVVIDVSNPASLSQVAIVGLPSGSFYAFDVIVDGNYAYQASYDTNNGWTGLLQMIDISNPLVPLVVDSFYTTVGVNFQISSGYAYLAQEYHGLHTVELIPPSFTSSNSSFWLPGRVLGADLQGNYAYVAHFDVGLQILDISTPQSPVVTGLYLPSADGRGVIDNVTVSGNYAYSGNNDLIIMDISDPASPALTGSLTLPYNRWSKVDVVNDLAFVANRDSGMIIIDVSTPSSPIRIGTFNSMGWISEVVVSNDYAYLAAFDSGLVVLDISNPINPTMVGRLILPPFNNVVFDGRYVYVATDSMYVVDCINPTNPIIVGSAPLDGYSYGTDFDGSYYYVSTNINVLHVYDITDKANPQLITTYPSSGGSRDVNIHDGYIYLSDFNAFAVLEQSIYTGQPPAISCPSIGPMIICDPGEVCVVAPTATDPDGDLDSVYVLFGELSGGVVCFYADTSGEYTITTIAVDLTGLADTCNYTVSIQLNEPPVAGCPDNPIIYASDLSNVCIPGFRYDDPNGNIYSVTTDLGPLSGGSLCISTTEGTHTVTMIVTDGCDLADTCSTDVTVVFTTPAGEPLSVSLDHVVGSPQAGQILAGEPIEFHIRVTNASSTHWSFGNPFRVSSPDGAQWGSTVPSMTGTLGSYLFDLLYDTDCASCDGSGVDSANFYGLTINASGMPLDFDDVAFVITLDPIDPTYVGQTICLDSSALFGSIEWLWTEPGTSNTLIPSWDGPHYFEIVSGAFDPPVVEFLSITGDQVGDDIRITGRITDCEGFPFVPVLGSFVCDNPLKQMSEIVSVESDGTFDHLASPFEGTIDPGSFLLSYGLSGTCFNKEVEGQTNTAKFFQQHLISTSLRDLSIPFRNIVPTGYKIMTGYLDNQIDGATQFVTDKFGDIPPPPGFLPWEAAKDLYKGGSSFIRGGWERTENSMTGELLFGMMDNGLDGCINELKLGRCGIAMGSVALTAKSVMMNSFKEAFHQLVDIAANPSDPILTPSEQASAHFVVDGGFFLLDVLQVKNGPGKGIINSAKYGISTIQLPVKYIDMIEKYLPTQRALDDIYNGYFSLIVEDADGDIIVFGAHPKRFRMCTVRAYCPVGLIVTDPLGREVSATNNEIPHALYWKLDPDQDGDSSTVVQFPVDSIGEVTVEVIPESGASPTDSFTVIIDYSYFPEPIVLADNVLILDLPATPYVISTFENQQPASFDIIAPNQNQFEEPLDIVFSWNRSFDPDPGHVVYYDLEISSDSELTSFITIENLTDTLCQLTDTLPTDDGDGIYYWRVQAHDLWGAPTYSEQTMLFAYINGCCGEFTSGYTGNSDCDPEGKRNLADITRLIDRVYISKIELCCEVNGNVDGDSQTKINLADITRLIDHIYISKLETAPCQ